MIRRTVSAMAILFVCGCEAFSWRYARPHPQPHLVGVAQTVHSATLANGLRVAISEVTSPVTYVGMAWRAGAIESPPEARQMASVVAATIFTDQRWKDALRATGGVGDVSVAIDGARLGASVQSDSTSQILAALSAIVRNPTCDAGRLSMAKTGAMQLTAAQPRSVVRAELELSRAMYSVQSVYVPDDGARFITCNDVSAFAARFLSPDRLAVVVSGDVHHDAIENDVRASFASVQARPVIAASGAARSERRVRSVALAGATETVIGIGRFMPARDDDNILRTRLVARIEASIQEALRKEGLTYSVVGALERRRLGSELRLLVTVPRAETARALHVIVDTIDTAPYLHQPYGEPMYVWRVANLQGEIMRQQEVGAQGALLAEAFVTGRDFAGAFRDVEDLAKSDIAEALVWANAEIAIEGLSFVLAGDPAVTSVALQSARLD